MRKASVWLLGGLVFAALAVFFVGHGAQAQVPVLPEFSLRPMQDGFPLGGLARLEVSVPPQAVGGFAHLYATIGPETRHVLTFPVHAPLFMIEAPVPPDPILLGELMTYSVEVRSPEGSFLGAAASPRNPVVDPNWD